MNKKSMFFWTEKIRQLRNRPRKQNNNTKKIKNSV